MTKHEHPFRTIAVATDMSEAGLHEWQACMSGRLA